MKGGPDEMHYKAAIPYTGICFVEFLLLVIPTFHIPCRHILHANFPLWYFVSKMFVHVTKYVCTQAKEI